MAKSAAARDVYAYSAEWQRLGRAGKHRIFPHPRLALTVHAGEDFADPLEGLFQVWAAIEIGGLEAGKRSATSWR